MTGLFMLYTLKAETAPFAMQAGSCSYIGGLSCRWGMCPYTAGRLLPLILR